MYYLIMKVFIIFPYLLVIIIHFYAKEIALLTFNTLLLGKKNHEYTSIYGLVT